MDIAMDRTYTGKEILALDLVAGSIIVDAPTTVGGTLRRRSGDGVWFGIGSTPHGSPSASFHIVHIPGQPEVESPPEVDWATEDMIWNQVWVAVAPNEFDESEVYIRFEGSTYWNRRTRQEMGYFYKITNLPPHPVSYKSLYGLTEEQAKEVYNSYKKYLGE